MIPISIVTFALAATPPPTAAIAVYQGTVIAGSSDGLHRAQTDHWVPIELGLKGPQRRIHALAVYGGDLHLGTDAGLIRVVVTSCGHRLDVLVEGATVGMSSGPQGLTVTTGRGAFIVDESGSVRRLGLPRGFQLAAR